MNEQTPNPEETESFLKAIQGIDHTFLVCTVTAIIMVLNQMAPNSESAIIGLAEHLMSEINKENEQNNQSPTE